ncbi:RHS repeat-associated protein [Asanoa ferruginea]|uniref:RHS repeat-associated protein n=1 Tax=Asanoa ferruginea TaxID=53367 RepID=A0A3D9ZPR8_9ACTN|nr:SpvB/TcaC N-terminal domain-containing protein [Asanoa ferruginea]REF99261.1 RHS repeat-associated protein [Asanoa ferruginea]GIF45860.1 hypothetical protein Afe04nite_03990 [Asanoa ferruginea]
MVTAPDATPPAKPAAPVPGLPKGGGAIRGLGEKFAANPVSGTGSVTVPIACSPARAGIEPHLTLAYDSGGGNGPFGLGWAVSLPAVTRKTDKGIPRYDESDVFLLSDAEDLVPELDSAGERVELPAPGYRIHRYRPRIEGLFARVERWTGTTDGDVHWRTVTRDNITSRYGVDSGSRIADPADPARVFSWLISDTWDDKGNLLEYGYRAEDSAGVAVTAAHESGRTPLGRGANRYPKRVRYGNRLPRHIEGDRDWMFEVVFDYGDHHPTTPAPAADRSWPARSDPFSTYRPGFEVRTYRLCQRILMFHHFPTAPEVGAGCLVHSVDLTYRADPLATVLARVTSTGHRRTDGGGYRSRSLPPLDLSYSPADLHDTVAEIEPASLPADEHQWVDLDGAGLPGLLTTTGGAWWFAENLGGGRFGPAEPVPALASAPPQAQPHLLDLAGDGRVDVVSLGGPTPGFAESEPGEQRRWSRFHPFDSVPTVDWNDPDLRFVDLDGDGLAEAVVGENAAFTWYPSRGEAGFGPGRREVLAADGPRIVFADPTESIHLADMSGDGLSDLVRVRPGEVCYWPNLGHGRFGDRVVLDGGHLVAGPEALDQRRVRLSDVDGVGPADLVYLADDGVRIYRNQSGNALAPPVTVTALPPATDPAQVSVVDLFGTGTSCLVWTSPLPGDQRRALRYVDLLGGQKPFLLTGTANNLGVETTMRYAPSTRFYLDDRAAGRPWATRLPMPVHVVDRVETIERISGNRFVSEYAYHHGYFDGEEREFRGFAMVEQWDTERFGTDLPPVLTRTWFHTGSPEPLPVALAGMLLAESTLPDTHWHRDGTRTPHRLTGDEAREACRALKGTPLRQEVYALDGTAEADRPYLITEANATVELLQPRLGNLHAVFLRHPRETVTLHYERALYPVEVAGEVRLLGDPRISHELVLAVDPYGNLESTVAVGYGRRYPDADIDPELPTATVAALRAAQTRSHVVVTDNRYTEAVDLPDAYRAPLPCEARQYELVGVAKPATTLFRFADLAAAADGAQDLPFEAVGADGTVTPPGPGPHRRLIGHDRVRYRADDLSGPLPLGHSGALALPYDRYRLVLTPGLVDACFRDAAGQPLLADPGAVLDEGGYLPGTDIAPTDPPGHWWAAEGRLFYSPNPGDNAATELARARAHFFVPVRFADPFGNPTVVRYDADDLLLLESRDPVGNVVTADNDYRVLRAALVTDPNGNRTATAYDLLGMVAGTAVLGKPGELSGDSLDGFEPDPDDAAVLAHLADPLAEPHPLLRDATSRFVYDLFAYVRDSAPAAVATISRETHVGDLPPGATGALTHGFGYTDGLGREIQLKRRAADHDGGPRWTASGTTVFNNKGQPVRRYEPFFSTTHRFEPGVLAGVSQVLGYDPLGRVVATLHPDARYDKTVFDPWRQVAWDTNDTVLLDPRTDTDVAGSLAPHLAAEPPGWQTWHATRIGGALGPAERAAAERAAAHAGTPTTAYADALARGFLVVAHNRVDAVDVRYPTLASLDVEGNQRALTDPAGRVVLRQSSDVTGNRIRESTMDAGTFWTLGTATGQALRGWDSRDHEFRTRYDALRRPVEVGLVTGGGAEKLLSRTVYGESLPDPAAANHRGRQYRVCDPAGEVTTEAYDRRGNPLRSVRRLAVDYRAEPDWHGSVPLEPTGYPRAVTLDALARPTTVTSPDGTVLRPEYDEGGGLARLTGNLRGAAQTTVFVAGLRRDAHGRREWISFGNGVETTLRFDPLSHRLAEVVSTRTGAADCQHLRYTYDPVGNVTQVADDAQQTVFFNNRLVDPVADYTYDAAYRLVEASGREHLGQAGATPPPPGPGDGWAGLPHPGDGDAMGRYVERYDYDAVGNILVLAHTGTAGGWRRAYAYAEASGLDAAVNGNRLSTVTVAGTAETFRYDGEAGRHGHMTALPHLPAVSWNSREHMAAVTRQVVATGTPETTYYVYDGAGERVRKVTDRAAAPGQEPTRSRERVYIGGCEVYREFGGDGTTVTLERETVHVVADQRRIALVETRTVGTDLAPQRLLRYQLDNHLGSACVELDDIGRIVSYEEYFPFGGTSYHAVRSSTETPKRYRYTGKELDEESGLYCYGARHYAAWLGRWVSPDPAGVGDGTNLYAYVQNRPIVANDPDGRWINILIGAAIGLVVGGGIEATRQLITEGRITSWGRIGAAAAGGAVGGAIAGATFGASLAVQAGAAAVGAAAGGIVTRAINGEPTTAYDVARDAAVGLALFGVFKGAGSIIARGRGGGAGGGGAGNGGAGAGGSAGGAEGAAGAAGRGVVGGKPSGGGSSSAAAGDSAAAAGDSAAGAGETVGGRAAGAADDAAGARPAAQVPIQTLTPGTAKEMFAQIREIINKLPPGERGRHLESFIEQVKKVNEGWNAVFQQTKGGGRLWSGDQQNFLYASAKGEVFQSRAFTPELYIAAIEDNVAAIRELVKRLGGSVWTDVSAAAPPAAAAPAAPAPPPAAVEAPAPPAGRGFRLFPQIFGGSGGSQSGGKRDSDAGRSDGGKRERAPSGFTIFEF